MDLSRVFENDSIIIYKRQRKGENSVPLYFEYSRFKGITGKEFRTIRQVKAYTNNKEVSKC